MAKEVKKVIGKKKTVFRIYDLPQDVIDMANELSEYYCKSASYLCFPCVMRFIKTEHSKIKQHIKTGYELKDKK